MSAHQFRHDGQPKARAAFAHAPLERLEQVVARQTTEEVPYAPSFEADAQVIDLEPGQALTWPFYAPPRVENLDRFCVSLSMDFQTWPTRFRNGALYANAVARARGGQPRSTDSLGSAGLAARWAASLALKKLKLMPDQIARFERDFEPEVGAVDGAGSINSRS